MLIKELVNTCSDPHVARGAVRSLGAEFFVKIEALANEHGLGVGEFVADTVQHFRRCATETDWIELSRATAGRDIPILCGLKHILEKVVANDAPAIIGPGAPIAADALASMAVCCCAS